MTRYKCDNCGANRGKAKYSSGSYCFACNEYICTKSLIKSKANEKNPTLNLNRKLSELNNNEKRYLYNIYINEPLISKYNIQHDNTSNRIAVPINQDTYWLRSLNNNIIHKWIFSGKKENAGPLLLKANTFDKTIVIVEDIFSAIRTAEFLNTICLFGTTLKNTGDWTRVFEELYNTKKLILWLDGDKAGQLGADKLKTKYKLTHEILNIITVKDPKSYSPKEMGYFLQFNPRGNNEY